MIRGTHEATALSLHVQFVLLTVIQVYNAVVFPSSVLYICRTTSYALQLNLPLFQTYCVMVVLLISNTMGFKDQRYTKSKSCPIDHSQPEAPCDTLPMLNAG